MDEYWWEADGWSADLSSYAILIRAFIEGRLSAPEFETLFLVLFKRDPTQRSGEVFGALDRLFADVDEYCFDPAIREQVGGLNGEELRSRADEALERLASLK